MSIFTSVDLDDYTLLEEESINCLTDTHQEIMKFYPILKKEVYLGNPVAIEFHKEIRGESEYDIPVTKAVAEAVGIPVVASGGAGNAQHMLEAIKDAHASARLYRARTSRGFRSSATPKSVAAS
jgi:hypothetical protein